MTRWQRWMFVAIVAVALIAGARPVGAHADLLVTSPAADSVLEVSPAEIFLAFTEPVDPTDDAIRLLAADGTPIRLGPITQDSGSDTVEASLPDQLDDGSYVVAWSVVSADSHPIRGAYVFSRGEPSADAGALADDLLEDTNTATTNGLWLGIGRFASYTGIAVLTGTLAMTSLLAPATLRSRRVTYVLYAAGYVALAGSTVMISAQAEAIGTSLPTGRLSSARGRAPGGWREWPSLPQRRCSCRGGICSNAAPPGLLAASQRSACSL